jgi:hypothetical protein
MRSLLIILLINISFLMTLQASPTDSISTSYKNGEFVTYSQVWVNASDSISYNTAKDYDNEMRYNLDALFSWALKGMNLRKEKNELMMFYLKSTTFDNETNVIKGLGDAIIPGIITFPNIVVESQLSTKNFSNGKRAFYLNMLNAKGFIKSMNNSFYVIPTKNKGTWYIQEVHVHFGWFFGIFITKNRFKSIMEWRLQRLVHNLRDEAERRERKQLSLKN